MSILTKGEISKGQLVTVYAWKEAQREVHGIFGEGQMVDNTALCGDPMEVIAVGLPYVKVRHVNNQYLVLDTRRMDLMELPKEFLEVKPEKNNAKMD